MEETTAWDYLQEQQQLEIEAKRQMPYDPKECTYSLGSLRQPLFACLTCKLNTGKLNAVCYACSIKCHTTHDLVELFTKRNRTCDCGTDRVSGPCVVRYPLWSKRDGDWDDYDPDIPDSSNKYGNNYNGLFCDCKQKYNPMEDSNMLQCIFGGACDEDWYHEECILGLRPGVINRRPIQNKNLVAVKEENDDDVNSDNDDGNMLNKLDEPGLDAATENALKDNSKNGDNDADDYNKEKKSQDDNLIDKSDDNEYELLPLPGFPSLDSFDTLICWKCVQKFPELGLITHQLQDCQTVEHIEANTLDARLVILRGGDSDPSKKKSKKNFPTTIFLKEGYIDKLHAYFESQPDDSPLKKFLKKYPFLHIQEETYCPPDDDDDDDDSSSIYELGMMEMGNIPPDQAAIGIMAMEKLQSKLRKFLEPFAQDGSVVTKEAVEEFFAEKINQE